MRPVEPGRAAKAAALDKGGNAGTGGSNGGAGNDAPVTFAVVGDLGADNEREASVADLIKGWNPAFIVTLGDNNYDGAGTIDTDVGKYYAPYIGSCATYSASTPPATPIPGFGTRGARTAHSMSSTTKMSLAGCPAPAASVFPRCFGRLGVGCVGL